MFLSNKYITLECFAPSCEPCIPAYPRPPDSDSDPLTLLDLVALVTPTDLNIFYSVVWHQKSTITLFYLMDTECIVVKQPFAFGSDFLIISIKGCVHHPTRSQCAGYVEIRSAMQRALECWVCTRIRGRHSTLDSDLLASVTSASISFQTLPIFANIMNNVIQLMMLIIEKTIEKQETGLIYSSQCMKFS